MSSPGFESMYYGTKDSVTNHYTGWAERLFIDRSSGLVESFFKNDEGHNVTVNGDRYRAMITNFFIPELNNHDVQELWFQQDGARCHTARATIDLLKDTYGDRLISRFGPVNWPPRSCDLTPLDYFLWGYVKSLVYADKPQTLDHLEDIIRRVIADIRPQMLEKVIENWTSRLDYIRASRGSPMPEIIFKIHPSGIVTSDAGCCAVGPGFESRRRHGCLQMFRAFAWHVSTLNSRQATSSFVRMVEGEERWESPDHPRVFSFQIGVASSKITLSPTRCSKLRRATGDG
ncbi:uncharacterized protein TNCV_4836971 [Trichonephila clavipes]|nr:uncharacterized protein TNCV_4836971 [Trichonephila clavipes]